MRGTGKQSLGKKRTQSDTAHSDRIHNTPDNITQATSRILILEIAKRAGS
jgi:hypothetical protein